jgi:hypothetical protein
MTLDLPATGAPGASSNLSAAIECADWAGIVPFEPLKTSATTLRTKTHRRPITADEERRLREILKDPAFWSGSTDGKDTRHGDGSIQRIEMVSGGQRAFMVSSSNPTFSEGARKDLRAILQRIILEVMS